MQTTEKKLMTSAEVIEKAGLGFRVRQSPVLFEGNGLTVHGDKVVNYREDTGEALGIVGNGYKVLQYSTSFAFLDSLIGDAFDGYEKAFSWKNGARMSLRVKLPGSIRFAGNPEDTGAKYVDFHTSHDGSTAIEARLVSLRLICSNGLTGWKKIAGSKMKHTLSMNLEYIRKSLQLMNQSFNIMESLSEKMAAQPFHVSKMPEVLEKVGLVPSGKLDNQSTRALNIINEVSNLFDGYGHGSRMEGSKGTAWGAYNAITEYVDHRRGSDKDKRAESSAIGSGARIKDAALAVLAL